MKNLKIIIALLVIAILGAVLYKVLIFEVSEGEDAAEVVIEENIQIDEEVEEEDETDEIIQKISEYCEEYGVPQCLPVTSPSVLDLDDKYSVIKNGDFKYLLTKKDNEWGVSIVSKEENICDTGSDSLELIEYCNR